MKNFYVLILVFSLFISCGKKEIKKEIPEVVIATPTVEEVIKTPEKEAIEAPKVVFTVQIAALKKENSTLRNLDVVHVFKEDSFTKYRLGEFSTYKEARKYRRSLLHKYPDAFVQALKNGTPIAIQEALKQ